MAHSSARQAGAEVELGDAATFPIPSGLTVADLQGAAKFIESYGDEIANEAVSPPPWSDGLNAEMRCAAKVYEYLKAAVAKNSENS